MPRIRKSINFSFSKKIQKENDSESGEYSEGNPVSQHFLYPNLPLKNRRKTTKFRGEDWIFWEPKHEKIEQEHVLFWKKIWFCFNF